jgi:DNA-binding NarL/FixJ family response regulator
MAERIAIGDDGETAGAGPVAVLVVDDQAAFRSAARDVIDAMPDFTWAGEAESGEQALAAAGALTPDLVVLDIRMPGMDGIETARRLTTARPGPVVVLISVEEPPNVPDGAGSCGAAELVRKQDFRASLLRRLWLTHGATHPS